MARKDSKPLSRRVLVTVKRDMTEVTPRVVWQHEIPLLAEIHGEGNVNEVDDISSLDDGYTPKATAAMLIHNKRMDTLAKPSESVGIGFVFFGDSRAEYERLAECYGRHREVDMPVVEKVYGRMQEGRFAAVVGQAEFADMSAAQLRELVISHGYLPQTDHDSTDVERRAADEERRKLFALTQAELVKLAEEVAGALA